MNNVPDLSDDFSDDIASNDLRNNQKASHLTTPATPPDPTTAFGTPETSVLNTGYLANAVGFDAESAIVRPNANDDVEVEADRSKMPLYQNPYLKVGILVGVVGAIVGLVAMFLGTASPTPKPVGTVPTPTPTPAVVANNANTEAENGRLKAQLAVLSEQKKPDVVPNLGVAPAAVGADLGVKTVGTAPFNNPTVKVTPPVQSNSAKAMVPVKTAPVVRAASPTPPQIEPVKFAARPVAPTAVRPTPTLPKIAAIPIPRSKSPVVSKLPTPATRLAYRPTPTPVARPVARAGAVPATTLSWQQAANSTAIGGRETAHPVAAGTTQVAEVPLNFEPIKSKQVDGVVPVSTRLGVVPVGRSIAATTIVPLHVQAQKGGETTISLKTDTHLVGADGGMLLPLGAVVTFKVNVAPDSGYISGFATEISMGERVYPVPAGAISIQARNSEPLVAQNYNFGNDAINAADRKEFMLGALANIGNVLTQPNSSSSTTAGGGVVSTSSSTQQNKDIFGAGLAGGFNPILAANQQRNQAELQRLLATGRLWTLPNGTKVQLDVLRSFPLE
jgi:hypothetical protein